MKINFVQKIVYNKLPVVRKRDVDSVMKKI